MLLGATEAEKAFYRARTQIRSTGSARLTGFDAVEVAAAAGLDARELYGEDVLPAPAADGQVDHHLDAGERPLVWTGQGLSEFGITPGSVLGPEQFEAARRLMRGEDPRTGRTLVEPKLAIAPDAKLPAAPLVRAVRRSAAEQGVKPQAVLDSKRKKDAFGAMERQLARHGEAHKVPASTVLKLADGVGVEAAELYGEQVLEKALAAEAGGHLDARLLLHAVEARARERGQQPTELFDSTSMKRRYRQTEAEAGQRLRDLPMAVREAVATAKAAGVDLEQVWDREEVKAADGKWSTMAAGGRDLHRHARATQAVMNARIRRELADRYGIRFRREERTGAWEIAAIPQTTIQLFSKRDGQVRKLLEELGIGYGAATVRERTAASTASKAAKNGEVAAADDVLRAYWQAEGRAAGDDPDALTAAALQDEEPEPNPDLDELCTVVFDPQTGLTAHSKEFSHAAAIAATLDALPHGVAGADEAEDLTKSVLRHAGYAVQLEPKGAQHYTHADRYTTADIVAAESLVVSETTRRLGEQAAVVGHDTAAMTLFTVEAQQGFAGRTTIMNAARTGWEAQVLVIAGASTAAVAAANLKAEAGIPARTLASCFSRCRTTRPTPTEPAQANPNRTRSNSTAPSPASSAKSRPAPRNA